MGFSPLETQHGNHHFLGPPLETNMEATFLGGFPLGNQRASLRTPNMETTILCCFPLGRGLIPSGPQCTAQHSTAGRAAHYTTCIYILTHRQYIHYTHYTHSGGFIPSGWLVNLYPMIEAKTGAPSCILTPPPVQSCCFLHPLLQTKTGAPLCILTPPFCRHYPP